MNSWISLALVLVVACLLIGIGAALLMARVLMRPARMTDGKAIWVLRRLSPGDLGLPFEPVRFDVRDGVGGKQLAMASWWIPCADARGRCVVLIHGYADAKVGAIAWAPLFHRLGWNILALDLRAHGESGGEFITAGHREREDLGQVIDMLRAERPGHCREIVLFGASYGAAMAGAAALGRDDVAGVIMESPFADFGSASKAHLKLMGLAGNWLAGWVLWLASRRAGGALDEWSPARILPKLAMPVMVIESGLDPFLGEEERRRLMEAIAARGAKTAHWHAQGVGHLMAICADEAEYAQRVGEFLAGAS